MTNTLEPGHVLISASRFGNQTYHRDPECRYVRRMDATREKPLDVLGGNYTPCSICTTD